MFVNSANFAAGDVVCVVSPSRCAYMVLDTYMTFANLKGLHKSMGSDAFYDTAISTSLETVAECLSRFYAGNVKRGPVDLIGLSPRIGIAPK